MVRDIALLSLGVDSWASTLRVRAVFRTVDAEVSTPSRGELRPAGVPRPGLMHRIPLHDDLILVRLIEEICGIEDCLAGRPVFDVLVGMMAAQGRCEPAGVNSSTRGTRSREVRVLSAPSAHLSAAAPLRRGYGL